MSDGLEEGFWDESPKSKSKSKSKTISLADSEPLNDALFAAKERAAGDTGDKFRKMLGEVFPQGKLQPVKARGALTIGTQAGDHYIGIIGTISEVEPNPEMRWESFWRQNVSVSANTLGSVEKAIKRIRTPRGFSAWLSWVHTRIVKLCCEDIKHAVHPDNCLPTPNRYARQDTTAAFRAGNTLHALGITGEEVVDQVHRPVPWLETNNLKDLCRVFRSCGPLDSAQVGTIGVRWQEGEVSGVTVPGWAWAQSVRCCRDGHHSVA